MNPDYGIYLILFLILASGISVVVLRKKWETEKPSSSKGMSEPTLTNTLPIALAIGQKGEVSLPFSADLLTSLGWRITDSYQLTAIDSDTVLLRRNAKEDQHKSELL
jgi:hypothetical protein